MKLPLLHQDIGGVRAGNDDHVPVTGGFPDVNGFGVGAEGILQVPIDPTGIPEDRSSHTADTLRDGTAVRQQSKRFLSILRSRMGIPTRVGTMSPGGGNGPQHRADLDRAFEGGKQFFRNLQRWFDAVQIPVEGERPCFLDGQPGAGFGSKLDGAGPIEQSRHLAAHEQKTAILLDQLRSPVLVACQKRMLDGFGNKPILLKPLGSAAMQRGEQMGRLVPKALPENVREEMVIAVPMTLIVQGEGEEIHPFQRFQHRLPRRQGALYPHPHRQQPRITVHSNGQEWKSPAGRYPPWRAEASAPLQSGSP